MLPTGSLIETVHESTFLTDTPESMAAFLQRSVINGSTNASAANVINGAAGPEEDTVRFVLGSLPEWILLRNRRLQRAADSLQRFHDPQQSKWVMAVHEVLQNAFRSGDADRSEHLRDALPLLRPVVEHPLSGRDYSLRFLMGWLLWKATDSPAEAAQSFTEAVRLSIHSGPDDPYAVYSQRHLSYMYYLQGNFSAAHETIQRALQRADPGPDALETCYEAARYAARAGYLETAQDLLIRSFDLSPLAALWSADEPDFQISGIAVAPLLNAAAGETSAAIDATLEIWQEAIGQVRSIEQGLSTPIVLPENLDEAALEAARQRAIVLRTAGGLAATAALRKTLENAPTLTFLAAKDSIEQALQDATTRKTRVALRISKLEAELTRWKGTSRALRNEAKQAGFSLTPKTGFRIPLIGGERRKRIEAAQANYSISQENEAEAQRVYDAERPGLRTESRSLQKTINTLKEALNEVQTALGVSPTSAADAGQSDASEASAIIADAG